MTTLNESTIYLKIQKLNPPTAASPPLKYFYEYYKDNKCTMPISEFITEREEALITVVLISGDDSKATTDYLFQYDASNPELTLKVKALMNEKMVGNFRLLEPKSKHGQGTKSIQIHDSDMDNGFSDLLLCVTETKSNDKIWCDPQIRNRISV